MLLNSTEIHQTGHTAPESGLKWAIFMSQTIFDDFRPFWKFFENIDFLTLFCVCFGSKMAQKYHKMRYSQNSGLVTERGIYH